MERLQKERESNKRSDVPTKQPSTFANSSPEGFRAKSKPAANDAGYDPMALVKSRVAPSESDPSVKKSGSGPTVRRRYYSSSDDDDDDDDGQSSGVRTGAGNAGNSGEKFLSKLESFNSDFWKDCETKDRRKSSESFANQHSNFQVITFVKKSKILGHTKAIPGMCEWDRYGLYQIGHIFRYINFHIVSVISGAFDRYRRTTDISGIDQYDK